MFLDLRSLASIYIREQDLVPAAGYYFQIEVSILLSFIKSVNEHIDYLIKGKVDYGPHDNDHRLVQEEDRTCFPTNGSLKALISLRAGVAPGNGYVHSANRLDYL